MKNAVCRFLPLLVPTAFQPVFPIIDVGTLVYKEHLVIYGDELFAYIFQLLLLSAMSSSCYYFLLINLLNAHIRIIKRVFL